MWGRYSYISVLLTDVTTKVLVKYGLYMMSLKCMYSIFITIFFLCWYSGELLNAICLLNQRYLRLSLSLPWPWGITIVPLILPLCVGDRRLCGSLLPKPMLWPRSVAELDDGATLLMLSLTAVLRYDGLLCRDCCCCWWLRLKRISFLLARNELLLDRSMVGMSSPSTERKQNGRNISEK